MWTPKQVWFYRQLICFSVVLEIAPSEIHVCCGIHVRATEAAEVCGAHLAVPRNPHFELRKGPDEVANVKLTAMTACISVFDHFHKQGSSPADDKRAGLDVQFLRDQQHTSGICVRWGGHSSDDCRCSLQQSRVFLLGSSLADFATSQR